MFTFVGSSRSSMRNNLWIFFGLFIFFSCQQPRFELLTPGFSGISFVNRIENKDTMNILDMEFVYNGGGVAIGDLNGDGLDDLYFTGNQVDNACYLNLGQLKFKDITAAARVGKKFPHSWSSGVNILDINCDGKQDIYVCNTLIGHADERSNLLFINQGNTNEGIPVFMEQGAVYGIDDPNHASHAQWFDYDNDGDLDLFLGINLIDTQFPNQYYTRTTDGSVLTRDVLYRNDWDSLLQHPVFTDVSLAARIVYDGYSHSTLINDFNEDGWLDIYVANDYLSNDLIYLNNQDGTFSNRTGEIFKHLSNSAMGSDVADINNDGRLDVATTEMQPFYNKRKKLFQSANNYNTYVYNRQYKYEYQYTRNTLQINQGLNPHSGLPLFSELGMLAGVHETDWSWSLLMADLDNDGWREIFIANGFPKDVTDHDFGAFRASIASTLVTKQELFDMIPEIKTPNFLFRQENNLQFNNVAKAWGLGQPTFSNGAAYGDLDNDGDLDLVINNINDQAFLYENHWGDKNDHHYLRLKLSGSAKNPDAIGAKVTIYYADQLQSAIILSGRGYLSQSEPALHFGLGASKVVDSVIIYWPGKEKSVLTNPAVDQLLTVNYHQQKVAFFSQQNLPALITSVDPQNIGINYAHLELDFVDFNFQRTLPHKFSQYGPSIAIGDINGDGREDMYCGAASRLSSAWYIQQPDHTFKMSAAKYKLDFQDREEDAGTLLFDADGDGDLDLYLSRGSSQFEAGSEVYRHVLGINDGLGNFTLDTTAIPDLRTNSSVVRKADIDLDGDDDLLICGRVKARQFPRAERTVLLRNDSKPGAPKFTEVTGKWGPELDTLGMISDAIWSDLNNDLYPDLILAGEWMPLTVFINQKDHLENVTSSSGLPDYLGWWTSLASSDFDQDGDMDFIAGNYGLNLNFKCSSAQPLRLYAKDFDNNRNLDPFISCYWPDSMGVKREYFYHTRDDMIKQLVMIRSKFQTYGAFGEATVQDVFNAQELAGAQIKITNYLASAYIENLGGEKFKVTALPGAVQYAPIFGLLPDDVDGDGDLDVWVCGNDYGLELGQGRADALHGLILRNDGPGRWTPLQPESSGFALLKDGKGVGRIIVGDREYFFATQNQDSMRLFSKSLQPEALVLPHPDELYAQVSLKDGRQYKIEFYQQASFWTQSSPRLSIYPAMTEVIFFNRKNQQTRTVKSNQTIN